MKTTQFIPHPLKVVYENNLVRIFKDEIEYRCFNGGFTTSEIGINGDFEEVKKDELSHIAENFGSEFYVTKNKESKGSYNNECYRSSCVNIRAIFYNKSTRMYYCSSCAKLINDANKADSMRLYGTPFLCELVNKEQ
jgi:hypothetical protein